eukprot:1158623-Pelagomonas_calceolata.AAC.4
MSQLLLEPPVAEGHRRTCCPALLWVLDAAAALSRPLLLHAFATKNDAHAKAIYPDLVSALVS